METTTEKPCADRLKLLQQSALAGTVMLTGNRQTGSSGVYIKRLIVNHQLVRQVGGNFADPHSHKPDR